MSCDACGKSDHVKGTCASAIGPFSASYCSICLGMGAEPKWAVEAVLEEAGDVPIEDRPRLIYYDPDTDGYVNTVAGPIPVHFRDGTSCMTRTEAGAHFDLLTEAHRA